MKCPKCGSRDVTLDKTAMAVGGGSGAAVGAAATAMGISFLFPPAMAAALVAGAIGAAKGTAIGGAAGAVVDKIRGAYTCDDCGHAFKA